MTKQHFLIALALAAMSHPASAVMLYVGEYSGVINTVDASVSGLAIGTNVTGSFTFDMELATEDKGAPIDDFHLAFADYEFTSSDLYWATMYYDPEVQSGTAFAQFIGRPGMGDFAYEFSITVTNSNNDPHVYLYNNDFDGEVHTSVGGSGPATVEFRPFAVPEPMSAALFGFGLAMIAASRRRHRIAHARRVTATAE